MRAQTALVIVTILLVFGSVGLPELPRMPWAPASTSSWIVVFSDNVTDPVGEAKGLGKQYGFGVDRAFTTVLRGFSARMSEGAAKGLLNNPHVSGIFPDLTLSIASTVPTGVDRVGAENVGGAGTSAGAGVPVAVIDTGVSRHPDLTIAGGYNCTTSDPTAWGDDHGHGTHVSGIIGARGGLVGVAPGTPIYAVKVLDAMGSGSWSQVICGIDWVAGSQNGGVPVATVVNMSLGGPSSEDMSSCAGSPLHQAICNATAKGIRFAVAAGNSGVDASGTVPAAYPQVIAVSALNDTDGCAGGLGAGNQFGADDKRASFSNYGGAVDVAAPGASIYSTLPGGGYGTMSGTSQAAPHVAAMLALGGYATEASSFGEPIAVVPRGARSCAPDSTAPDTQLTNSPSATSPSHSATLTYRSTEAGATFECAFGGAAFAACSPNGTTLQEMSDGAHSFAVRSRDAAGNLDPSPASTSWRVLPKGSVVVVSYDELNAALAGGCYTLRSASAVAGSACDGDDGAADGRVRVTADGGSYTLSGGPAGFDSIAMPVTVTAACSTELSVSHQPVSGASPTPTATPSTDPEEGQTIQLGVALSGTIQPASDVDRFVFSGTVGQVISVAMTSLTIGSPDAYLEVWSPSGVKLATSDDDGGATNSYLNAFRLPESGQYLVVAQSYGGQTSGSYRLLVADDNEDGRVLVAGTASAGRVLAANDTDQYSFDGKAGQILTVNVKARNGSSLDVTAALNRPGGTLLASDDNSGAGSNALIRQVRLPKSGRYTIVVASAGARSAGGYTITVTTSSPATQTATPAATAAPKSATPTRTPTAQTGGYTAPSPSPTPAPPTATPSAESDTNAGSTDPAPQATATPAA